MERAIVVVEDSLSEDIKCVISETSSIVAERTHRCLPHVYNPENYGIREDFSPNPARTLLAESKEPKRDFIDRLVKSCEGFISDNRAYVSVDPSAAVREAWAFFNQDLYGINHRPTRIDLEIEKVKAVERKTAVYKQNMNTSQAPLIARRMKPTEHVLLVGGLKEKEVLAQTTTVVNVDHTRTGQEDVIGDVERGLPFSSDGFDHVVMFNLFEILYNPRRAYSEAYRVLKPGGALWVREPYSMESRGYGLLLALSNEKTVYEELRLRGLLYYPDQYEAFSISPPLIRHAMRLGGFFRAPVEVEKDIIMVVK